MRIKISGAGLGAYCCVCVPEQKLLVFATLIGPGEGHLHTHMPKASRLLVYRFADKLECILAHMCHRQFILNPINFSARQTFIELLSTFAN
jgi:hypothetical protein